MKDDELEQAFETAKRKFKTEVVYVLLGGLGIMVVALVTAGLIAYLITNITP